MNAIVVIRAQALYLLCTPIPTKGSIPTCPANEISLQDEFSVLFKSFLTWSNYEKSTLKARILLTGFDHVVVASKEGIDLLRQRISKHDWQILGRGGLRTLDHGIEQIIEQSKEDAVHIKVHHHGILRQPVAVQLEVFFCPTTSNLMHVCPQKFSSNVGHIYWRLPDQDLKPNIFKGLRTRNCIWMNKYEQLITISR